MARTRLRSVKLDEISFVGKGDNPEAHVLLLKMKKSDPSSLRNLPKSMEDGESRTTTLKNWIESNPSLLIKEDGDAVTFNDIQNNRELRDKLWGMCYTLEESISSIACDDTVSDKTAMISQSIDQFKAAITAITKGEPTMSELKKAQDDLAAALAQVETLTKENETLKAATAEDKKKITDMEAEAKVKKDSEGEDPIYKGLPEAVVKKMKDDSDRIAKMEANESRREYVGKAASVSLVGKADDLGEILLSVAKHDAATADKLLDVFKAAHARIQEGDLLKEKGAAGAAGSTSAYDMIVAKAAELRKSRPELTEAKAFTEIYDTDEALRKQYLAEREGK